MEGGLIVFIIAACGLSPALFGFYKLSVWGPIALFVLAGLLGLVIARPATPRPAAIAAIGGLLFLWLWSLASSSWAESADQALLDANRWMLYAAVFAVLVLLLRNDHLGRLLIGTAAAAVVAFGLYLCVRLLLPEAEELFLTRRLDDPLGYVNGQAGYLLLGLWPLVAVAERVRSNVLAGAAIAAATILCGLALLGQTRAVLPALVISALVLLAVLPGRRARIWVLLVIVAGVALAAPALLDVYDSGSAKTGLPDPDTVRRAVLTLVGGAVLTGGIAALGRVLWLRAAEGGNRRLDVGANVATGAICVTLLAGGLAVVGDPIDRARDEARAFKNLRSDASPGRSRFSSGAGNRYDYWRVAVHQFEDHPFKGIGAGGYDRTYFVERRSLEDVRQAHSIFLQTLGELGLVGALGLLLFLGAVLAGFAARVGAVRQGTGEVGLVVAGGGMFLLWLVHTGVDWLHLIPGVTGIALCGAAVLVAPWSRGAVVGPRRPALRMAVIGASVVIVLAGAAFVGRATLADKYRSDAEALAARDPAAALQKVGDSLALNDESLPAYYVQAAAHARLNDYRRARASLVEATRREPHDFVTWGLLGDLAVRRGALPQARRAYSRASRLNPKDDGLRALADDPSTALPASPK